MRRLTVGAVVVTSRQDVYRRIQRAGIRGNFRRRTRLTVEPDSREFVGISDGARANNGATLNCLRL